MTGQGGMFGYRLDMGDTLVILKREGITTTHTATTSTTATNCNIIPLRHIFMIITFIKQMNGPNTLCTAPL